MTDHDATTLPPISDETLREKLLDAEKRAALFLRIFEKSTAPSIVIDEDMTILLINEKVEELLGYPREYIEGKVKWTRFVVDDDLERMMRFHRFRRDDESGAPEEYECRLMNRAGEVHDIWIKLNMIQERASLATLVNVTSRKKAEQNLKLREDELRVMVENFPGYIYTCYLDYSLEFMNTRLKKLVERDGVGERCHQVIYHRQAPCPWCRMDDVYRGDTVRHEFMSPLNQRWYSVVSTPIYATDGTVRKRQTMLMDVTDRKIEKQRLLDRADSLKKENLRLKSTMNERYRFGNLIGKSHEMQAVYEMIVKASASDANIIVYGESGTGKELVAREIHRLSDRSENGFIPVNCGAIPEHIMESEFFGYTKGAFTGATHHKKGYLDLADHGTLFLDELGEIGLSMQVKLLRAIEGYGFIPLGGKQTRKPDVRIIAATNRDLDQLIRQGHMREDFFYRIHIIPIHLPPLRKRTSDVPLLIEHFLSQYPQSADLPPITPSILDMFQKYHWPGNVRQLNNVLHRYVTMKNLDFLETFKAVPSSPETPVRPVTQSHPPKDLKSLVAEEESRHILRVLEQNRWHRGETARHLGINRRTLERKMKAYGFGRSE